MVSHSSTYSYLMVSIFWPTYVQTNKLWHWENHTSEVRATMSLLR